MPLAGCPAGAGLAHLRKRTLYFAALQVEHLHLIASTGKPSRLVSDTVSVSQSVWTGSLLSAKFLLSLLLITVHVSLTTAHQ